MQSITGKPELMKQMNTTLLYKALIELRTATRAELAEFTQISATTVRSLLEELLRSGEITETARDESSGGRRAQRYCLNSQRNLVLLLYLEDTQLVYQVNDLLGNVLENGTAAALGDFKAPAVLGFISKCLARRPICAIGLGVPGIVENKRFFVSSGINQWGVDNLGEQIQRRFQLPVVLENDLNAIAFGFAIRHAERQPACGFDSINIAYIHFNKSCAGAGIIINGKVVRGAKRFAGELGFLPMEENWSLDRLLQSNCSRDALASAVYRVVSIVNCVTNPSLIVIGGDLFSSDRIDLDRFKQYEAESGFSLMQPEILLSSDYRQDYLTGLACLTIQALIPKLPLSGAATTAIPV